MGLQDETVAIDEIAQAMGRTAEWLKKNWRRLHKNKNFPHMLPGTQGLWSRPAVRDWMVNSGELPVPPSADTVIAGARAALHEQMGVGQ